MIAFFLFACNPSQSPQIHEVLFKESLAELNLPLPQKKQFDLLISELPSKEKLSMQYFPKEEIIYLALNNYLWLDDAKSTAAATLTITQIAVFNYEIMGAKLQLNPKSGAIIVATEIDAEKVSKMYAKHNYSGNTQQHWQNTENSRPT